MNRRPSSPRIAGLLSEPGGEKKRGSVRRGENAGDEEEVEEKRMKSAKREKQITGVKLESLPRVGGAGEDG